MFIKVLWVRKLAKLLPPMIYMSLVVYFMYFIVYVIYLTILAAILD